jgi:hypothetical protein
MAPQGLGFLQLCADRRYHRVTMEDFEARTGLRPDQYWIEAAAGGAPGLGGATATARFAYDKGARIMGWAAHGGGCGGFPGTGDDELRAKLHGAATDAAREFPEAEHWALFAAGGRVEAAKVP